MPFNDGAHIIYVNGKYRGNDPIGDLMHDFSCKKSADMKNRILADKVRNMKENEQGVQNMCKIMEEFAKEERAEERIETQIELALHNLEEGIVTEAQIEKAFRLTHEQVQKVLELYHEKKSVKA